MAALVEASSVSRGALTFLSRKCKRVLCSRCEIFTRNNHTESAGDNTYDVIITGGGMVGTSLACALANNRRLESRKILLLEGGNKHKYEPKEQYSNRVVALNKHTRVLLSSIGAWKHIEAVRFTPVRKMQVWDACSDAMITFNEDHLSEELAYIVENDLLLHAVETALSEKKSVKVITNAKVEDISLPGGLGIHSNVQLEGGETFKTKLLDAKAE